MKKIFLPLIFFILSGSFFLLEAQEFKYQILSPASTFGESGYSEYFWKGNIEGFKKYCVEEAHSALEKYYGKSAMPLSQVSSDIKSEEELKNNIYIRVNVSRMQLSYELLGTENFQYALRTTGGIEFFNVKTGEVYFSKIYTIIQPKQVLKKKADPLTESHKQQFYELFKNNVTELFDFLFQKSKEEYKPGIVKANIVKTISDFSKNKTGVLEGAFAINKGRLQGIAERQQYRFTDSKNYPEGIKIRIIEIQDNYSVASIISPKPFTVKPGEEIYRSGGAEISGKYPVRMMVSGTEILGTTEVDSRFKADPGFITQIIHDNFSDNSQFQMLPYGSIAEQQLEATKSGEKEEDVIGNRQKPDVYIKCIISKAYVYSTPYKGGDFLKLTVVPVLLFYDANLGNILYSVQHEEQSLQVIKENDRIANLNEQFEILAKNAIYEITKKAKSEFKITRVSGNVTTVSDKEINFQIESGKLAAGTVFRTFKKKEMLIDPVSKKELGNYLVYNGNIKTNFADGAKGKGAVLFVKEPVSGDDIIRANSDNTLKGNIIVQASGTNIHTDKGEAYNKISDRAILINSTRALAESGKFVVVLPPEDMGRLAEEKVRLEPAGHFVTGFANKSSLLPQVKISSEIIVFPSEVSSETKANVNVGLRFTGIDAQSNKEVFRKGQKQTLPLKGDSDSDQISVGLKEYDHYKYYLNMCYDLGVTLSGFLHEELQKTIK